MTVLTIRAHKRYAVKRIVCLERAGRKPVEGLVIEISAEGCRISNLGTAPLAADEALTMEFADGTVWPARVRWAHSGLAGIRLIKPLHVAELAEFIEHGRAPEYQACYGT